MKYKLTSHRDESVTIDGLGVLPPATEEGPSVTEVDSRAAESFRYTRGLNLSQARVADGVEVEIVLSDEPREE